MNSREIVVAPVVSGLILGASIPTLTLIPGSLQATQAGPGFDFRRPLSHSPARPPLGVAGSVRLYSKPD